MTDHDDAPIPEPSDKQIRELYALAYEELRKLAHAKLRHERNDNVHPTSIVHEAYAKLRNSNKVWESKAHLFRAAAQAMRCIIIDRARSRATLKRGGDQKHVQLNETVMCIREPSQEVLLVDNALNGLEQQYPKHAELVKLRYFMSLTIAEAAEALGISKRSADRMWTFARAWLVRDIRDPNSDD